MKKQIAKSLLDIQAVFLRPDEPFIWSSGLESPIYCDNRLTMAYPKIRKEIAAGLSAIIKEKFHDAELIAGTATAGIPHAAWVSDALDLPMCYVRSSAKKHGKGNQIEGIAKEGQKVVVIEDLISTGGSSLEAVAALKTAGCEVLGIASIFTYGLKKAEIALEKAGVVNYSLTDYETLIMEAAALGYVKNEDLQKLREWQAEL
ncbi:orotate phosphoribosyltransferase [Jeotgalibacillus proteolyticus]|uniref:Orotate phosphoribosyltransferase n=1 Tax=Jeotgalibacillus proteolyticus TaxID=2082395 RepID=A0A2S5GGE9_9BACL|nr:orotate phosphoribosyltransferase [Jeotgalibacillus proteolyticus]PPA72110.1 orotate phosphoribosyltransferase [Jeotgalibacillus proteolyticus]